MNEEQEKRQSELEAKLFDNSITDIELIELSTLQEKKTKERNKLSGD